MAWRPPSTGSVTPVQKEERSEARNSTASATSSGSPTRPIACVVVLRSRNYTAGNGVECLKIIRIKLQVFKAQDRQVYCTYVIAVEWYWYTKVNYTSGRDMIKKRLCTRTLRLFIRYSYAYSCTEDLYRYTRTSMNIAGVPFDRSLRWGPLAGGDWFELLQDCIQTVFIEGRLSVWSVLYIAIPNAVF